MVANLQSSFEKNYKSKKNLLRLKPDEIIEKIIKSKKKGDLLHIGAGEGRNALLLAKKGFKVTCIDYSPTAIKRNDILPPLKGRVSS
jgi:2-polyprenyl-3-methyl-5-hydroxy-6-metoxy-1,4-benzoquinol methylase